MNKGEDRLDELARQLIELEKTLYQASQMAGRIAVALTEIRQEMIQQKRRRKHVRAASH